MNRIFGSRRLQCHRPLNTDSRGAEEEIVGRAISQHQIWLPKSEYCAPCVDWFTVESDSFR